MVFPRHQRSIRALNASKRFLNTSSIPVGKYNPSKGAFVPPKNTTRDVVIIGGGHNGLIAGAYLGRAGQDVLILERRHCVGGAAVTEEIVPGFKFSRASYLAGLLRPDIISDLQLEKYGFKYLPRDPSSFTPTTLNSENQGKYLILGQDEAKNYQSIAQFSKNDADNYPKYEEYLGRVRDIIQPILDTHPIDIFNPKTGFHEMNHSLRTIYKVACKVWEHRNHLSEIYEFMTAPAQQILSRWFQSDILRTTLATDAVVGFLGSPKHNGSAYVLLHHIMGEAAGKKGVWAYVEGGMGKISQCILESALSTKKVEVLTNAEAQEIIVENGRAKGVRMSDGTVIHAKKVISACTPWHTFMELMPEHNKNSKQHSKEYQDFISKIQATDYACGSMKINCAVDKLPDFACYPNQFDSDGLAIPGPQHQDEAYRDASIGKPATRPVIEMTIPSVLDKTIAPPGKHVVLLFVQFAPYELDPKIGSWADEEFKNAYADKIFSIVDEFCPGFSSSVIGRDVLSPLDLERIFGLHKGSIFHGAIGIHQIGYARPVPGFSSHRTPIEGIYMGAAGAHPGGGVMGAPGRNCARVVLSDMGKELK